MRIGLISTLAARVAPDSGPNGSVEGFIWVMSRELTERGHDVTVFAAEGSTPCGELVAVVPGPYATDGAPDDWYICEFMNLCEAARQSHRFDVVHSNAYLWGIPLEPLVRAPMVHTMHVTPYESERRTWELRPSARVTAISAFQWSQYPHLRPEAVIYHGIDADEFTFGPCADGFVCYLGRFTAGKGPLEAIAAAKDAGTPIVLAGPRNEYFTATIEPLVDGTDVVYAGSLDRHERDDLLMRARALIYPVQSPEPFGLVMAEAMMCGTPVIGLSRGAVPEIVQHGVTGLCAESEAELPALIASVDSIDRATVRAVAVERFSLGRMVDSYVDVYHRLAGGHR